MSNKFEILKEIKSVSTPLYNTVMSAKLLFSSGLSTTIEDINSRKIKGVQLIDELTDQIAGLKYLLDNKVKTLSIKEMEYESNGYSGDRKSYQERKSQLYYENPELVDMSNEVSKFSQINYYLTQMVDSLRFFIR